MSLSVSANASGGLAWPELIPGKLLKRYKRFLADVKLETEGIAQFPDAVTIRGLKHITDLENLADDGHRCLMFYFIQRMDAQIFRPADHIDPQYGQGLRRAVKNGIEILAYDVRIDMQGIELNQNIFCEL
jgi:sugar fermentation stimulation protein A